MGGFFNVAKANFYRIDFSITPYPFLITSSTSSIDLTFCPKTWKPTSPRKKDEDKMIPLYVMVRRKNYTKAKIHLTNEAQKFR